MSQSPAETKGRALGVEWQDWDGDVASHEVEIKETSWPFTFCLIFVLFIYWFAAALLCYLMLPRLRSIHPHLATAAIAAGAAFVAASGAWLISILISNALGRAVPAGAFSRRVVLHFVNPLLLKLAGMFGYSKDRIGHSFIEFNNALAGETAGGFQKTIILLPRCLRENVCAEVLAIAERHGVPTYTAGGGEHARRVIARENPDSLIAVACERDLLTGIKDTNPTIAVIAIPNIRREGPCRNTEIDMRAFEKTIEFFKSGVGEAMELNARREEVE